jgi:hypothetical protein
MRGSSTLRTINLSAAVVLLVSGWAQASSGQVLLEEAVQSKDVAFSDPTSLADWIVKSADSICGVSTARQITNPAKVDYDKLLKATSEMKELRREGIDKNSARGQALVTKATQKVRETAKRVMTEKGHCSVWKKISNKSGKTVADLTSAILPKLD